MITIENINGRDYTVVWNNDYDADNSKSIPLDFTGDDETMSIANGALALHQLGEWFATALPALPRHPTNDDATVRLLHLYRAHGIDVYMDGKQPRKTHATFNGERVGIAIEGGK